MKTGLWTLALIAGLFATFIGLWGLVESAVGGPPESLESMAEGYFWVALGIFVLALAIVLSLLSQRRR